VKCRKCKHPAVIKLPRHNTAFCGPCFETYLLRQVEKAISGGKMLARGKPVLVAVSGGKDSLALWDMLLKLGYDARGLHLNLGIGTYSEISQKKVEAFADAQGLNLTVKNYCAEYGLGVVEIAKNTARPPCSACGTMKRYHFNRMAMEAGYAVVATGHNLDDEAARLMGNVLKWQTAYLKKQSPVLTAEGGRWAKKVKPLYRLPEREIAAYAILNRIDYIIDECPMSQGAKMFLYKEILNRLEEASPGTKHQFYLGFLKEKAQAFPASVEADMGACSVCGQACQGAQCSYCRLIEKATVS